MSTLVRGDAGYKYDICIVGLKCWGCISGAESPRYIGGIETDLTTLAKTLAESGKRVALITYDEGQPPVVTLNGVAVYRSFSPEAGWPGLRFVFPRASGLISAIRRVDAPVIVQMGAGVETGWTALAIRLLSPRRRFIFFIGGDRDCKRSLPAIRHWRERVLYRIGLRLADCVVAQTESQAAMLKNEFGITPEVLRLPNRLESAGHESETGRFHRAELSLTRVLWVGRIDKNKRPHLLLELAERCPQYHFDVVGEANIASDYSKNFHLLAGKVSNITLHGKMSRRQLAGFYRAADVLCCTSEFEGFPATFLEAWSVGLPTISTVDPGHYISAYGAGQVVSSTEDFFTVFAAAQFEQNRLRWSENARRLYESEFSPQACLVRFNALLSKVA